MTDGFDQALVAAALALLQADVGPPALRVFDGIVPDNTDPDAGYVLVYAWVTWTPAEADSLAGDARTPTLHLNTHNVSTTAEAARGVRQRTRTQLLNKRLVVAGLNCGLIREEPGAGPPQRDETTGTAVLDASATFRTIATT